MNKRSQRGFTLVEIAISFLIIALLLGGALMTLGAQNDVRATAETQRTLQQAQEALLGFAASQGRLPCPAEGTIDLAKSSPENDVGTEALNGSVCKTTAVGNKAIAFLPGATLALTHVDAQGFLLDAWGNRVRYSVVRSTNAFTTTNLKEQMREVGIENLAPDLKIFCTPPLCKTKTLLTGTAVAVIFSTGRNSPTINAGNDEAENLNGGTDDVFISHEPRPAGAPGGEFDDIVTWLSPYTLYNRMIAAGAL